MDRAKREVMTIDELAAYLQIPKSTLYRLAHDRKVPGRKVGRQWRFHRDAVDTWLAEGHSVLEHPRMSAGSETKPEKRR